MLRGDPDRRARLMCRPRDSSKPRRLPSPVSASTRASSCASRAPAISAARWLRTLCDQAFAITVNRPHTATRTTKLPIVAELRDS